MLHGNDNIYIYIGGTLIIVGTIYYIHDTTNVCDTFTFLEFFATASAIDHFPTWHLTNCRTPTTIPTDSCALP